MTVGWLRDERHPLNPIGYVICGTCHVDGEKRVPVLAEPSPRGPITTPRDGHVIVARAAPEPLRNEQHLLR